jgi:hypothetical protein
VDGGFLCNYPLQQCIAQIDDPDEIFGLNKCNLAEDLSPLNPKQDEPILFDGIAKENDTELKKERTKEYENIIDYLLDIIGKTEKKLVVERTDSKYTMEIADTVTSAWEVYEAVKTKESRAAKIQYGVNAWEQYKQKIGFKSPLP